MARRGNSTSIILLLVCLILLVGGVTAGYVAIDKKIIENPFASLLQGEPMTLPSSEPISVPATSTEETDFFMKTDRPKAGIAPFLTAVDSLNLTPGTTINCTRFVFPGDSTGTTYRYMGGTEVRKYPNASIAKSWGAPASTAISCRGLTKGPDMKGNWPTGTTVKCAANDKKGSSDTLYYYTNPDTLMAYETTSAVDYYDPNWESTTGTIPDCSDYTLDSSYTIFDPRPSVGETMPPDLPELKDLPGITEVVYCKAFPPVGGTTETLYKYPDGNTLQPYIDKLTHDSWATEFVNKTRNANCMGAKLGDTIGYGRWRQGRTVKCGGSDTYYAFYRDNRLRPYKDYAHAKSHDPKGVDSPPRIGDCSYYTIGKTMWEYPSSPPSTTLSWNPDQLEAKPSPSPSPPFHNWPNEGGVHGWR